MKTNKGYTLTQDQLALRESMAHYPVPGPSYRRDIRDALASLQYAETSEQADYWLNQADGKTYEYR